ncbi:hypothetical protein Droror1_Dr00017218 [Drosera rotundifolia]
MHSTCSFQLTLPFPCLQENLDNTLDAELQTIELPNSKTQATQPQRQHEPEQGSSISHYPKHLDPIHQQHITRHHPTAPIPTRRKELHPSAQSWIQIYTCIPTQTAPNLSHLPNPTRFRPPPSHSLASSTKSSPVPQYLIESN